MNKKPRTGCYHCGSDDHRAKHCPESVCRKCGGKGHDVGGCPLEEEKVDKGSFEPAPASCKFLYIGLFAGIGGFRIALDRLGGHCVFASEIDRFARANYELNHLDRPAGDITKISEDLIPDHDLLVGGFPCQTFSSSGALQGFNDDRGVLFLEIVRILKFRQPKAVLLENVRGLLTHDEGRTLKVILSKLEEAGYVMQHQVLDAVNLVPQERKRIYLIGIRKDLWTAEAYQFPDVPCWTRGFADIMDRNLDAEDVKQLVLSEHQLQKVRSQRYTQRFPDARFLSDVCAPIKTLQSSYASYMVGSQFVPVEGTRAGNQDGWRKLSPTEAARLQGFPETFRLCRARPYHLPGNAVVPSMIAFVVAPLLTVLDSSMDKANAKARGWQVTKAFCWRLVPQLIVPRIYCCSRTDIP